MGEDFNVGSAAIYLSEMLKMYLHAIRSPLLWHINSIAESIIRSAMFKPSWSSAFRHRLEAFRKSSMHGLVFRTGSLKSNSKYKKGLWLIKYIGDENDKAFLLLLLLLKSALEKFQITFFSLLGEMEEEAHTV